MSPKSVTESPKLVAENNMLNSIVLLAKRECPNETYFTPSVGRWPSVGDDRTSAMPPIGVNVNGPTSIGLFESGRSGKLSKLSSVVSLAATRKSAWLVNVIRLADTLAGTMMVPRYRTKPSDRCEFHSMDHLPQYLQGARASGLTQPFGDLNLAPAAREPEQHNRPARPAQMNRVQSARGQGQLLIGNLIPQGCGCVGRG